METEMTNNRRKGQVARLPKVLRDKVNTMLDDGATYSQIVAELKNSTNPPLPHSVNEDNIGNWQKGGYQDYLRNQTWAEAIRGTQEKVLSAAAEDPVKFADAGVQLAATGICELLAELSRLQASDEKASDRYARIANSMARLARVILSYAQHNDAVAKAKAAEPKQRDPNKPFGDESDHRAVVKIVDKVLGIDRYRQMMMEQDAAAGRPWPSQQQSSATSNIAQPNTVDGALVSNWPSEAPGSTSEQGRDDRAASSSVSLSSSGGESRREEAKHSQTSNLNSKPAPPSVPSASEISNLKSEIPSTSHNQPFPISATEREERRPWNWNQLSDQAIENWRKDHNLL